MAYIGSAEDARRIRKQEEEREKQKKEFEERKRLGESNVDGAGLRQFGAGRAEVLEAAFKNETVGLVTREEFLNKKNTLKDRLQEEAERERRAKEQDAAAKRAERQRKKQRTEAKSKLSFVEDDAEAEEGDEGKREVEKEVDEVKLGKNPNAETSFLPDHDREKQEQEVKQQIEQEYEIREQVLRNEPLEITYSFFDGSGHRRVLTVKRGDSVGDFLKQVREQLGPEFKELRNISLNNLLFVKEDVILPHTVTFHKLITRRIRGKTGPLFDFGVHDDVRACSDSRIQEKTDAHAGKVVTRNFYDRNKHIFPASKWEPLTPDL